MARALSILYWLLVAVIAAVMFLLALCLWALTRPFDRRRVALHAFTNVWAALYTWLNPVWRVKVCGREHIEPGRTYVMVSNHLSLVDIFVVHRLFRHFKWVSKAENFRIPFIGWNMTLNAYVPLRRGERDSVLEMFTRCHEALAGGSSVMMFPEGTRSRTGQLRAFKPGAFELAKQAGVPVLPMVIEGTFGALQPRTLAIAPARMRLTVLPAIAKPEVEALSIDELCELVRERIAEHIAQGAAGSSTDEP
ncbi:MAG: 1-acyl-sn-glycerol-3-phosphate acyltransferase [Myxococcales bacterium]|nr:1-acyl-sn-glycerol-3-phosphate acyltransferase [Myxococcales bacterium]